MSHNPYSPPQAAVELPPTPDAVRPRNVRIAAWLLVFAMLAGISASVYHTLSTSSGIEAVAGLVAIALAGLTLAAVAGFVIVGVAKGWRWARILSTAAFLYQLVQSLPAIAAGMSIFDGLVFVVTLLPQSAAAFLLFTPSANAWFRRPRE